MLPSARLRNRDNGSAVGDSVHLSGGQLNPSLRRLSLSESEACQQDECVKATIEHREPLHGKCPCKRRPSVIFGGPLMS